MNTETTKQEKPKVIDKDVIKQAIADKEKAIRDKTTIKK